MLDQLWSYWRDAERGRMSLQKLDDELAIWMSQHCVAADDFAFGLCCTLRGFVAEAIETVHA